METHAGNTPAWGEDWGYKRADSRCSGDVTDISPARQKDDSTLKDVQATSHSFSALLFCVAFWILMALAAFLGWTGR